MTEAQKRDLSQGVAAQLVDCCVNQDETTMKEKVVTIGEYKDHLDKDIIKSSIKEGLKKSMKDIRLWSDQADTMDLYNKTMSLLKGVIGISYSEESEISDSEDSDV